MKPLSLEPMRKSSILMTLVLCASGCGEAKSSAMFSSAGGSSTMGSPDAGAGFTSGGNSVADPPVPGAAECPDFLPAPPDCGDDAELCGTATPIAAGGTQTIVSRAVPVGDFVFFRAVGSLCSEAVYRVSLAGGDAERVTSTDHLVTFEADDTVLYLLEGSEYRVRVFASGLDQVIGTIPSGIPSPTLARTEGGVVSYDASGANSPSFLRLTPSAVTPIATDVVGAALGSAPAFDGESVFFTWSDPAQVSNDSAVLDHILVSVTKGVSRVLGTGANTRLEESLATDTDSVYFVTGDPGEATGTSIAMGISRIAKAGGAVAALVGPLNAVIQQIFVDDSELFFTAADASGMTTLSAIPKNGGNVREVWHGKKPSLMRSDRDNVYFSVYAGGSDVPQPGGFVVRVPKR